MYIKNVNTKESQPKIFDNGEELYKIALSNQFTTVNENYETTPCSQNYPYQ
jgi:hypothetical protein